MRNNNQTPPMACPGLPPLAEIAQPWSVAYCKPRQEKALARDLLRMQIPYFLPLVERTTFSGGRRRKNYHPLFSSYVFIAGSEEQRLQVLRTERTVSFIEVRESDQPNLQKELISLEIALRHRPESVQLYKQLAEGTLVRVKAGPMKNLEGIVLNSDNPQRLLLRATILGTGATIEIDADLLEVASQPIELTPRNGSIELPDTGVAYVRPSGISQHHSAV